MSAARPVVVGVAAAYAIGLGLFILYLIREILILAFIAWIVAAALRPAVDTLSRRLPRGLSIGLVYLGVLAAVVALLLLVVPPLVVEVIHLAEQLPEAIGRLQAGFVLTQEWLARYGVTLDVGRSVQAGIQMAAENVDALLRLPLTALRVALGLFAVLVLSFYWLLTRERAIAWLVAFLPAEARLKAASLFDRAEAQMGAYVRGLAVLCLAVGLATFLGLLGLGVPFALALAVIAGLLELLPNIGPIISAVPAVILALTQSPLLALGTAGLYLVVQQLENYVLVPKVHEKSVGLDPLAILLAVLIGGSLAGLAGAVLAVPVAALIKLLIDDWREWKRE